MLLALLGGSAAAIHRAASGHALGGGLAGAETAELIPPHPGAEPGRETRLERSFAKLPLRFEANVGQVDRTVRFLSRGPGHTLFLTPDEAVLALSRPPSRGSRRTSSAVVRMRLLGANRKPAITGAGRLPGASNYMRGNDPRRWRTGARGYRSVRYAGVYPGLDLVYHGNHGRLEYDFVVSPGADPGRIRLAFDAPRPVTIDSRGDLVARTSAGELRQRRPFAYQRVNGERRRVPARFALEGRNRVGFRVGRFDRTRPLVIDPALVYSTYLGGGGVDTVSGLPPDQATGIAVDSSGSAYVTGETWSIDFPTRGAYQPQLKCVAGSLGLTRCTDVFVTKLSPDGASLVYSTYLGGDAGGSFKFAQDFGYGIAVDSAGHAYVTGKTSSENFPTTQGALRPSRTCASGASFCDSDAFVTKLSPDGSTLAYSTYLGGSCDDAANGIALDSSGNVFVAGETDSESFPAAGASACRGSTDAFAAKLNATGSALDHSTFLGGSKHDSAAGVALEAGKAYVTGTTSSPDFPTGSLQPALRGPSDAFVTKLDPGSPAPVYSTYLGGSGADGGAGLALNSSGQAFVTGFTTSTDFPTTMGAWDTSKGAAASTNRDAFVTKLNTAGNGLDYSTYLGGSGDDEANGIALESGGTVHVAGGTQSDDFPARSPLAARATADDAFVTTLDTGASGTASLAFSSLLGGTGPDVANGLALGGTGGIYVTGSTESFDFPVLGAFQAATKQHPSRGRSGFAAKIAQVDPAAPLVTGVTPGGGPLSGGTTVTIRGTGLSGVSAVRFGDAPAQHTSVSDGEITAVSPAHPTGAPAVTVTTPAGTSPPNPIARFVYGLGAWGATDDPPVARRGARVLTLHDGKVLMVSGSSSSPRAELYDPKLGTWAEAGQLGQSRGQASATLLPLASSAGCGDDCGKVLVVGDESAELYDPESKQSMATLPPFTRHGHHTATLLGDGRVLVAGDFTTSELLDPSRTVELYNPATGLWTLAGSLLTGRSRHTATLLEDGRVLVAGGEKSSDFKTTDSAELYDPRTQEWTATGALGEPRADHTATLLPDGRVLVAGGIHGSIQLDTAEVYNPSNGTWKLAGRMASRRQSPAAALLPSGKVLVAGGMVNGNPVAGAELYDPAMNGGIGGFVSAGLMTSRRGQPAGALLTSDPARFRADLAVCGVRCGRVLIAGGQGGDRTAELYTPPPTVGAIAPKTGPAAGGTEVAIEGGGFTHEVREVRFGAVAVSCPSASCRVESYSRLTVTAPASATNATVPVTVLNTGGLAEAADRFTYGGASGPQPPPGGSGPVGGGGTTPGGGGPQSGARDEGPALGLVPGVERLRALALRRCLSKSARPRRGARRPSPRTRRRAERLRRRQRRRCVKRHGRSPGRVTALSARGVSRTKIVLRFRATGSDGRRPPAARTYVVKQSRRPIRGRAAFRRAQTLCNGRCRFSAARVGIRLTLTITGLRPKTSYYYAVAARDNVSGRIGPRSRAVRATTR